MSIELECDRWWKRRHGLCSGRVFTFLVCLALLRPGVAQVMVHSPYPDGPLSGTLLQASTKNAPTVLLIPGSGPTNRDGNVPGVYEPALLKRIAEGLQSRGINSVRADKRGMYDSRKALSDPNAVRISDYATDASSWIQTIRRLNGAKCVWVLGHSEGGLVGLVAVQQHDDVCGLILLSTAGRPLGAVLKQQLQANPANAPILANALMIVEALELGHRVRSEDIDPALLALFSPSVQDYLIDIMKLDPSALLARYSGPVLILQGKNDLQVSVADAELLHAADRKATLLVLPNLDHQFMIPPQKPGGNSTAADRVDGFVDQIADFIVTNTLKN